MLMYTTRTLRSQPTAHHRPETESASRSGCLPESRNPGHVPGFRFFCTSRCSCARTYIPLALSGLITDLNHNPLVARHDRARWLPDSLIKKASAACRGFFIAGVRDAHVHSTHTALATHGSSPPETESASRAGPVARVKKSPGRVPGLFVPEPNLSAVCGVALRKVSPNTRSIPTFTRKQGKGQTAPTPDSRLPTFALPHHTGLRGRLAAC